jgi:hypothetical protein
MVPNTLGRRAVLLAGAALLARPVAAASAVPQADALTFRMIRHGSEIGTHALTFTREGDALTVRIAVEAVVTLLSIPLVRYSHRASETWHGTTLVAVQGETNKNGEREWMTAQRTDAGLEVHGSQTAPYIAPATAIPTSYWDKRMLNGKMISLEDGVLLAPKVADLRTEKIRLASGREIAARHYNLSGAFEVDLWYDATGTWAGMAMTVTDGSEVRYERL